MNDLLVLNALIFTGDPNNLLEGTLRIADGRMVEIGGKSESRNTLKIDARGSVVIPGLIDCHFHAYGASLNVQELETWPMAYLTALAGVRLKSALRRGFTTVRDVAGGDPGLSLAITQGLLPGPRYIYSGAALSQTGGHGDVNSAHSELCLHSSRMTEVVDGADNIRRTVRNRIRAGAGVIKIMTSGGVISLTDPIRIPQYTAEEVQAATSEASRRGLFVAAHAYSPEAIIHSVTNGVKTIEHANLLDDESAKTIASNNAFMIPTLVAYDAMTRRGSQLGLHSIAQNKNTEVFQHGMRALEIAKSHGVKIGFGTDLMGSLEDDQLIGLRLQHEILGTSGLLNSVGPINSAVLQREDLGSISIGAVGDLLILGGNPWDQPSLLWTESPERKVIQGGQLISSIN